MGQDIDRKLRLTAALLGAVTRKDLAAAFRRANPATSFHVERADKWLQARAQPRDQQVYEDWAKLLDVDRSAHWIAHCDVEAFIAAICARHGMEPEALLARIGAASTAVERQRDPSLAGTYVCYSHAWSPYFSGRLIRGCLTMTVERVSRRMLATYVEALPTGRLQLDGPVLASRPSLHIDVRERGGEAHLLLCLFPPTLPVSVLAGFMCGATVIGPDAQPSATRIVIVRLPAASAYLREADAYLSPHASLAADLARLGLSVVDVAALDRELDAFLGGGRGAGLDQIPVAAYRSLVGILDQAWLGEPGVL